MKRIFLIAALFALPALSVSAQVTPDALVEAYKTKGYSTIEVTVGRTQTKVEAIKDARVVEVVYNTQTGDVLKSEEGAVDAGDDIQPGISVRQRNRDFVKDGGDDSNDDDSDDDNDDDSNDDDSNDDDSGDDDSGDDSGDDNGSDDHGDDHDSGDDHGGDDHGGDDHGGDDHGGDDHGSDS